MRVIEQGHCYELEEITPEGTPGTQTQQIVFVKRFRGAANQAGVLNQELLRALIHRLHVLNQELPSELTTQAIYHCRMALILHEARALIRKVEKNQLAPEYIKTALDGHFKFSFDDEYEEPLTDLKG